MACGAARKLGSRSDLILLMELVGQLRFVWRRYPGHVEDRVTRPKMRARIAMAVETPLHEQRFVLKYKGHFVDTAMAFDAANALVDVDAVVEVTELGEIMNPLPANGFAGAIARADQFERSRA